MPRDLLAKLGNNGASVKLADFASERIPKCLRRLHQLLKLDALLRPERSLAEKIIVRKCVAGFDPSRGVDRLPLAGRLDFSGPQQCEHEQSDNFEVPSERL